MMRDLGRGGRILSVASAAGGERGEGGARGGISSKWGREGKWTEG